MRTTVPYLGHFMSKVPMAIIPAAVVAGVIGAYVLNASRPDRAPAPADKTVAAPLSDDLTAEERRELTRQMLKARRENPEVPASVRPTPDTRAANVAVDGKAGDLVSTGAAPPGAPVPLPRAGIARGRAELPATAAGPATASATGTTTVTIAPAATEPTPLAPVTVNASPTPAGTIESPRAAAEPNRGFAANVLSSISVLAGTAANATGNTVNWVIELPGKAISAGGKILGGDAASSNPPPPAPAPKRNVL